MLDKWIEAICDELHDACKYAKKSVIYRTEHPTWAKHYAEMAETELVHAKYLIEMGEEFATNLSWKSQKDKDEWMKVKEKYAEKSSLVKMMLQG